MALARAVSFDGVSKDRIEWLAQQITEGERPEGLPANEMLLLYDPDAGKALALLFFETEDDYRQGDAILNAMPSDETPGQRASVAKYTVAARMTA
jgi:hypothetical protein